MILYCCGICAFCLDPIWGLTKERHSLDSVFKKNIEDIK